MLWWSISSTVPKARRAAATSARSAPTNVIEAVADPIAGSSGSPALYASATPTVVAATANTISATTSTCWRHSRRNSRHDQRKIARRAGPPPEPADLQLPRPFLERQTHDFASGASSDSGPARRHRLVDDTPVAKEHHPVGPRRQLRIVRDHDAGHTALTRGRG